MGLGLSKAPQGQELRSAGAAVCPPSSLPASLLSEQGGCGGGEEQALGPGFSAEQRILKDEYMGRGREISKRVISIAAIVHPTPPPHPRHPRCRRQQLYWWQQKQSWL